MGRKGRVMGDPPDPPKPAPSTEKALQRPYAWNHLTEVSGGMQQPNPIVISLQWLLVNRSPETLLALLDFPKVTQLQEDQQA